MDGLKYSIKWKIPLFQETSIFQTPNSVHFCPAAVFSDRVCSVLTTFPNVWHNLLIFSKLD